ncbi:hypothetical protein Dimus_028665 [Dionaea muscipula]
MCPQSHAKNGFERKFGGSSGFSIRPQAVLVAWDCNPRWLIKHLPSLAASRDVPIIHVKDHKQDSVRLALHWLSPCLQTDFLEGTIQGIRMFHEQDADVKKPLYGMDNTKPVMYGSNYDLYSSTAANWRDSLVVNNIFTGHDLQPSHLPPIFR